MPAAKPSDALAAARDARAMTNIAELYANGRGVPQDNTKAREWKEKAAAAARPTR